MLTSTEERHVRVPSGSGPSSFWELLFVKFLNTVKRAFGVHVFAVQVSPSDSGGDMPRLPPEVVIRLLDASEIRSYVDRAGLDFRGESVDAALQRGDVCVGAFVAQQLVSYSWRAVRGPVPHNADWEVIWNPGLVYRYKALTLPEYRGLHINEALAKTVDRHLAKQGHAMGLSFVEMTNVSSMRTLTRKGRKRVGYAGFLQRFSFYIPFRTSGCRSYGFRFNRRK